MAKKKKKAPPRYKSGPKKGQFMNKRAIAAKKASRKKKAKKPRKTALAKRGKTTSMAKGRKKGRGKRRGNPNGGGLMRDKDLMIGGVIYGFISQPGAESDGLAASFQEQTAKLPDIGNRDITNGLALYALERYVWRNKWLRETSRAAMLSGAVRFGRRNFTLGAGGDDFDMSGALDVTPEGEELSGIVG